VTLRGQFGVSMIADVLAGATNEKIQRWRFEELTVYGLLRAYNAKRIVAMLHRLMEAGLARQRDPDGMKFRPVVELTAAGVAVMKGEQPTPATLADLLGRGAPAPSRRMIQSPSAPASGKDEVLDEESQRRFERLRSARIELARAKQLPPYCICHDSTLKSIARAAPKSLEALELIKGMGPNKVRMYGQPLLDALEALDA
jgi:ATP-dependent DNA helicase RecQ